MNEFTVIVVNSIAGLLNIGISINGNIINFLIGCVNIGIAGVILIHRGSANSRTDEEPTEEEGHDA